MRVGSLFSGIGGFDLGFERAGHRVVWQSEIDQKCSETLAQHWPGVPNHGDITSIDWSTVESPDVLCGGFPCQDLSVAGKRAGLAGLRSGLFFEFARAIEALAPTYVIIENVPGLLSSQRGRDMGTILGTLDDLGYLGCWRVLDARGFGVPQRRRRVFLVGRLGDIVPREVLSDGTGGGGDPASRREAWQEAAGPVGASASPDRWAPRVSQCLSTRSDRYDAETQSFVAYGVSENQRAEVRLTDYSRQLTTGGGKPGQGYAATFIPEIGVRRLTPTECERLQGFPDGWTEGHADTVRYKQLGNAVCVPVAEWIGRRLVQAR